MRASATTTYPLLPGVPLRPNEDRLALIGRRCRHRGHGRSGRRGLCAVRRHLGWIGRRHWHGRLRTSDGATDGISSKRRSIWVRLQGIGRARMVVSPRGEGRGGCGSMGSAEVVATTLMRGAHFHSARGRPIGSGRERNWRKRALWPSSNGRALAQVHRRTHQLAPKRHAHARLRVELSPMSAHLTRCRLNSCTSVLHFETSLPCQIQEVT